VAQRCIDLRIGQKILSYDLLEGEEKQHVDVHLEKCAACRDLLAQVYGKEGALDDLNFRAWKLTQRQKVAPHWWIARRLQDLWGPFLLVLLIVGGLFVFLTTRGGESGAVRVVRFSVSRGAEVDASTLRIDPGPNGFILRTDRDARVYVYEVREGSMRRLVPGGIDAPPELTGLRSHEVPLPPTKAGGRYVIVLVPVDAPGSLEEWDAAVFADLARNAPDAAASSVGWPGGAPPTLRWYP
jgi:hypothetical protein